MSDYLHDDTKIRSISPLDALPFKTVVFDLDGTLVDTSSDVADELNTVLSGVGRQNLTEGRIRRMTGHGVRALLQRGLAATGDVTNDFAW